MRFKVNTAFLALTLFLFCLLQCDFAACYKTEVEITPSPIEEPTTKKTGFFGGIKNYFRGTPTTTTAAPPTASTAAGQKPPPLILPQAPLMPLGPRPDTPPSSPVGGRPQQQPNWPAASASTTTVRPVVQQQQFPPPPPQGASTTSLSGGNQRPGSVSGPQPNLPPGFTPYRPSRPQPSGLDLSYGGAGAAGGRPQNGGIGGAGLAPLTSSTSTTTSTTTTTTTTAKPAQRPPSPGLIPSIPSAPRPQQVKDDFPPLPSPRRPSTGAKEDFPALPTPRSPSPTPTAPGRPSSPSAWTTPKPAHVPAPGSGGSPSLPSTPTASPTPNRVAFVPHAPGSTTTARPGSAQALATDAEIRTLTETLYTKEVNSQLNLIHVNAQGKTRSIDSTDEAPQPLLEVDLKALEPPTIAKMRLLFNNYEMDTLTNEHVTPNERLEENDFLDAVMATSVMRQAMLFLQNKGIVSPDPKVHRDLVKELWFTQYSRGKGKIGSSGFEHVFVNEVLNGTIIGLHNWVYFNEEEKSGRLDYKGHLKQLDVGTKAKVVKMRFTHNGLNKPVNSLFIGTSPELELALYTVCFKLRPDSSCPVSLGNSQFGIVTYSWRYRGKSLIGSAFPEI